jgi:uncharacterized protein
MIALVTGASSGIGECISYYLADLGYDLVCVAKENDKLKIVTKNIKTNVKCIVADLTNLDDVYRVYEECKDMDIDLLVNNAGFGLFGEFSKTDLNLELKMIDLNVRAYHVLTKLFLNDFIKRNSGFILNVCSSAGFMAGPRMATYYATKNYITKLTMAINQELKESKSNVSISALCPGPVNTNFNNVGQGRFALKEINPRYVAKYAIDKTLKRKMIIIPGFGIRLGVFLLRFIPYRWQLKFAYQIQWHVEDKNEKK